MTATPAIANGFAAPRAQAEARVRARTEVFKRFEALVAGPGVRFGCMKRIPVEIVVTGNNANTNHSYLHYFERQHGLRIECCALTSPVGMTRRTYADFYADRV